MDGEFESQRAELYFRRSAGTRLLLSIRSNPVIITYFDDCETRESGELPKKLWNYLLYIISHATIFSKAAAYSYLAWNSHAEIDGGPR